jgi:hypothetical protein
MSRLVDRFPQAHRVAAPKKPTADTSRIYELIEPYLDWILTEIDLESVDILIVEPRKEGVDPNLRKLVILSGQAVNIWLRHQRGIDRKYKLGSSTNHDG